MQVVGGADTQRKVFSEARGKVMDYRDGVNMY